FYRKRRVNMNKITQQNDDDFETENLFQNGSQLAYEERQRAQRKELYGIATSVREMFRTLSDELVLDRERSLALIAEYTGILTDYSSQVNRIRESRLGQGLDSLVEKLEQGLEFLIGFFTAHEPTRAMWHLDRTE